MLLSKANDMEEVQDSTENPGLVLIDALRGWDPELANNLINTLRRCDHVDSDGKTALMMAAYRGYSEICEKLLAKGANVLYSLDSINLDGDIESDCALVRAKCSHDARTIEVIETAELCARWMQAKVIKFSNHSEFLGYGWECLLDAARLGMPDLCAEMIIAGIPLKRPPRGFQDDDPIVVAADYYQIRTCVVLIALGSDPVLLKFHEHVSEELARAFSVVAEALAISEEQEQE
jgi:hypothetical protein